jgi:hypothetical protein
VVEVIARFFSLFFVVLLPGVVLDVVNVLGHLIILFVSSRLNCRKLCFHCRQ